MVKSKFDREREHKERLLEGLWELYQDKKLTDVTLVVSGREFQCNRNVLAASSPYFRAMFTSNVQEVNQERITLYDVAPEALECILNFMYTGLMDIGPENAQDIFMASNLFELLDVVDCCVDYMDGQLHISNCIEMYKFANFHHCEKLQSACKNFILQHFTDISFTEEFLNVDGIMLEQFLECDDIYVKTEDFIFEVIEKWIKHDIENRRSVFPRLFHKIRLPLISEDFFQNKIVTNPLVRENSFCTSIIDEFIRITSSSQSVTESQSSAARQRSGMLCRDLIIFSGGSFGEDERSFTAFDPVTMKNYFSLKHHPTFDLKYKLDFFQLITLNETDVYFLGGIFHDNYRFSDSGKALKNVYKYDQRLSAWVPCEHLIIARCAFSVCSSGSLIFVSGGKTIYPTGSPIDDFEVYDSDVGHWKSLAPMPLKLYHHASVAVNEGVYIFGGKDIMDEISEIVMRFDINSENWYTIDTKFINPRFEHTAIAINNEIFLVGGMTRSAYAVSLQIFNVNNNRWRYGRDFPDERKTTAVTSIKDKIYVCGGIRQFYRRNKPTRTVESKDMYSYDAKADSWWKISRMIQYANPVACTCANINTNFLKESDFISAGGDS